MGLRGRTLLTEERLFFITTTCYKWYNLLDSEECKSIICENIKFYNHAYLAQTTGYVIMPNHFHLILYFKEKSNLSGFMRDFKKFSAYAIRGWLETNNADMLEMIRINSSKQKFKVWQDRFDDLYLENRKTLEVKLEYIHQNPVKKGLVSLPEEYRYSSARFYYLNEPVDLPILHYMEII